MVRSQTPNDACLKIHLCPLQKEYFCLSPTGQVGERGNRLEIDRKVREYGT